MRIAIRILPFAFLGLTACMPVQPVVSDFNGASVKIQRQTLVSDTEDEAKAKSLAEATRICQAGGKVRAEYASTRALPDYTVEDLFLCLES